jgi:hypothetical protein
MFSWPAESGPWDIARQRGSARTSIRLGTQPSLPRYFSRRVQPHWCHRLCLEERVRSYLITLMALLTMGVLVSMLTLTEREEAEAATRREIHTLALYSLTESLIAESDLDRILDAIERHILETFGKPLIVWMPGPGGLVIRFRSARLATDNSEGAAVNWTFENGEEAGWGTERFPDSSLHYLPLKTWKGVVGVLGIQSESSKEQLPSDEKHLLSMLYPARYIRPKVPRREIGTATLGMNVDLAVRRKMKTTATTRRMEIRRLSSTSWTDARMVRVRSGETCRCMAGGMVA